MNGGSSVGLEAFAYLALDVLPAIEFLQTTHLISCNSKTITSLTKVRKKQRFSKEKSIRRNSINLIDISLMYQLYHRPNHPLTVSPSVAVPSFLLCSLPFCTSCIICPTWFATPTPASASIAYALASNIFSSELNFFFSHCSSNACRTCGFSLFRYTALLSSYDIGRADSSVAAAEAETGWPVDIVGVDLSGEEEEAGAGMRGAKDGIGASDAFASATAASCASMRW